MTEEVTHKVADPAMTAVAGFELVVDEKSVPYLRGAVIDFVDTIEQQGFVINNPNAGGA